MAEWHCKQLSLRLNSAGVVLFSFVLETFDTVAMTEGEDQCHFAVEDLYLARGGDWETESD